MTNMDDSGAGSQSLILKSDSRGRVVTPATRREMLLDEFERSGLSGTKFAALSGVKYQTFANWVHVRRHKRGLLKPDQRSSSPDQRVSWLEAVVQQAQGGGALSGSALWLHLPGGARAEIASAQQASLAASLIRALDKPC